MYYGKMWMHVKPTVGLPLFFGAVAATSLIVHIGVLTHTSWYPAFLNGNANVKKAEITMPAPAVAAVQTAPSGVKFAAVTTP